MKKFSLIFALICCFTDSLFAQKSGALTGQVIIDKVLAMYASLPYYMDSTVVFRETESKNPYRKSFSTAFIRDAYFEIQGESFNPYRKASIKAGYYYEKSKELSLSWIRYGEDPLELDTFTMDRGMFKLIGTGGSAAKSIAKLLMPDSFQIRQELEDFSRTYKQADELIDSEACYVLDLYFPADTMAAISPVRDLIEAIPMSVSTRQYRYWIRKFDFLILKYDYRKSKNEQEFSGTVRIFPQPERAARLKPSAFLYDVP